MQIFSGQTPFLGSSSRAAKFSVKMMRVTRVQSLKPKEKCQRPKTQERETRAAAFEANKQ